MLRWQAHRNGGSVAWLARLRFTTFSRAAIHFYVVLALLIGVNACRDSLGPARPRVAPKPDPLPPLRPGVVVPVVQNANYQLNATLDVEHHRLQATARLQWTNRSFTPVDRVPFHLYMNAFAHDDTVFMQTSHGEMRGAAAGATGAITIRSLKIASTELVHHLQFAGPGADQTVAWLPLPTPVLPNGTLEFEFAFDVQLPEVFARAGYQNEFHMVGQWYPKIGVRTGPPGAERWHCEPYSANGEFFADFGTYDVNVTAPVSYNVAGAGVRTGVLDHPDGTRTHTFRAEAVHDFAWAADPFLGTIQGFATVPDGKVLVRVYYRPGQNEFAQRHLAAGIAAVEHLSTLLFPYPYSVLTIIDPPPEAADGAGGMEYPTLVTTEGDHALMRPGLRLPEFVTIHEVGHQWFGGMLASNEAEEAWLDEGVNEWAVAQVMEARYGVLTSAVNWRGIQAQLIALRRALSPNPRHAPLPAATAAARFPNNTMYAEASYETPLFTLATLEGLVGSAAMRAAMRAYAQRFAFTHPTGEDFFVSMQRALGDYDWLLRSALSHGEGIDISLEDLQCSPLLAPATTPDADRLPTGARRCHLTFVNHGRIEAPVEIAILFTDGASERHVWPQRHGRTFTLRVDRMARIQRIEIDPDRKLVLDDSFDNVEAPLREGTASLHAAARAGFWTQTLMQAVGL